MTARYANFHHCFQTWYEVNSWFLANLLNPTGMSNYIHVANGGFHSGHRSVSKPVQWRAFFSFGNLFCQLVKYAIHMRLLEPDQNSHTQSMVAKLREASQIRQTFIPLCEKHSTAHRDQKHGTFYLAQSVMLLSQVCWLKYNPKVYNQSASMWLCE